MKSNYIIKQVIGMLVLFTSIATATSCKDPLGSDNLSGEKVAFMVRAASIFENDGIENKSNSANLNISDLTIRERIPIEGGLQLFAEFIPTTEDSHISFSNIISKEGNRAAISLSGMTNTAPYELKAYRTNPNSFDKSTNYLAGQESNNTNPLLLDGGQQYRIIGASTNTTNINKPTFGVATGADIYPNATVATQSSTNNGLYIYDEALTIAGQSPQILNPKFKNVAARIKSVTIEAEAALNINIQEISAHFINLHPTATYKFSDQTTTGTGNSTSQNLAIIVPGNTRSVSATAPTGGSLIAGNQYVTTGTTFFEITRMRAGNHTITNVRPFSSSRLVPGMIYNLKLTIKTFTPIDPKTEVEVNGQVWQKYNVGVNPALNHDDIANYGFANYGDYFLFGRKIPFDKARQLYPHESIETVGLGFSTPGDPGYPFFYDDPTVPQGPKYDNAQKTKGSVSLANNSWNLGTEAHPQKNLDTDPCAEGYRVPTYSEIRTLTTYILAQDTRIELTRPITSNFFKGLQFKVGNPADNILLTLAGGGSISFREVPDWNNILVVRKAYQTIYLWSSTKSTSNSADYLRVLRDISNKKLGLAVDEPANAYPNPVGRTTTLTNGYGGIAMPIRCIKQGSTERIR